MAYLDSSNVADLVADIKALADAAYLFKMPVRYTGTADNLVDPGLYYVDSGPGSGFPEAASTRQGLVFVFQMEPTGNHRKQIFWRIQGSDGIGQKRIWIRTRYSATSWSDWTALDSYARLLPSPTVETSLPTGITAVSCLDVIQSGNVVTVSLAATRDSTALNSWKTIASGLPAPVQNSYTGTVRVPHGAIFVNGSSFYRPLLCVVSNDSSTAGELMVARGGGAGEYIGSFTYLTNDFSQLSVI